MLPLAPGIRLASELDTDIQRVRHARQDDGCLRRRIRRVLQAEAPGKPYTVVGDGTRGGISCMFTDIAEAFRLAAESGLSGPDLEPGRRQPQSVNRWWNCWGGEPVHIPKRPGGRIAPGPISRGSGTIWAGALR